MSCFQDIHQPMGRTICQAGNTYLFFGGTSYLSLSTNADYIALYKEGIDKYGLNNGTSRNNNVQHGIYAEAEENLSTRFGFEDALLLSSGYLAAQLAVRQLKALGEVLYAPSAHPALWIDNQAPLSPESFEDWISTCVAYINSAKTETFVVVSNTLDNLKPLKYDFSSFKNVLPSKKVYLLLDDSHGIGVAQANQCYVTQVDLGSPSVELVVVASLAKGMATDAGVILCSRETGALLRRSPFFSGASPTSPAAVYALIQGESLYKKAVLALHKNRAYLHEHLGEDIKRLPDFPVFTVNGQAVFQKLLERGVLISSFSYPLPGDPPINRIVVAAHHTKDDLSLLIENLSDQNLRC